MRCNSCGGDSPNYFDYCRVCHIALDGSGKYERGFSADGKLAPEPEIPDNPWIFLVGAILCWMIAAYGTYRVLGDGWHSRYIKIIFGPVCLGLTAFAKYRNEKELIKKLKQHPTPET